jgi:uncharacterized protein (TIGR02145 family)
MLYLTNVLNWHSHRDSKGRVGAKDRTLGRKMLINTNRITDLTAMTSTLTGASFSKFRFIENSNDRREAWDYMEVEDSVANLTAVHETVPTSEFITLPVFPKNDVSKDTVDTTFEVADIIYADNNNRAGDYAWVVYSDEGHRRKEILVNHNITEILDLISNPLLDYDGNAYDTVTIGDLEWIVQGLQVTHYADGTEIPYITNGVDWVADTTGAQCCMYHNLDYAHTHGRLYNWYAVDNASGLVYFDRDAVPEVGWRVPTVADWTALSAALGGDTVAGGMLRETGTLRWLAQDWSWDTHGFRSIGSGNRFVDDDNDEGWFSLNVFNDIWSADQVDADDAYSIYTSALSPLFTHWNHEKFGGMTVRCCRDV